MTGPPKRFRLGISSLQASLSRVYLGYMGGITSLIWIYGVILWRWRKTVAVIHNGRLRHEYSTYRNPKYLTLYWNIHQVNLWNWSRLCGPLPLLTSPYFATAMDLHMDSSPEPGDGEMAGPIRQLEIVSKHPITPHLTLPYVRARRILHLARNMDDIHTQLVCIARQALRLVVLLNDRGAQREGPDKQERDERAVLSKELIELEKVLENWSIQLGGPREFTARAEKVKRLYDQFFRSRFYYTGAQDVIKNQLYQKLLAYDKVNMTLSQRNLSVREEMMEVDDMTA